MNRILAARVLTGILALAVAAGSMANSGVAPESVPVREIVDDAIVGAGPWLAKLACAGCVGAILAAGGSSIVGLIAIASAYAAGVGLCAGVCTVGFF